MCSICGEESTRICARCTKDSCNNHLCDKCLRCSDCCECEVMLSETVHEPVRRVVRPIIQDDEPEVDMEFDQDDPDEEPVPVSVIPSLKPEPTAQAARPCRTSRPSRISELRVACWPKPCWTWSVGRAGLTTRWPTPPPSTPSRDPAVAPPSRIRTCAPPRASAPPVRR